MRILITGINGFIGKNLARALLENKDIFIAGVSRSPSFFRNKNYVHLKADITDPKWTDMIKDDIDIIIHLAQSKYYRDFPNHADDIFNVNIASTVFLLDWARKNNAKRFIFSSTGNIYGFNKKYYKESDKFESMSIYSITKYCSELIIQEHSKYFEVVIARLFGVYGAGQDEMVIPDIINKVINGKSITLAKGKGLVFTPIYISDCVRAIENLISMKMNKKIEIINIAGDEIVNLKDVTNIVEKILKIKADIKENANEPKYLIANNNKLKKVCNNPNFIDIASGLKLVIKNKNYL